MIFLYDKKTLERIYNTCNHHAIGTILNHLHHFFTSEYYNLYADIINKYTIKYKQKSQSLSGILFSNNPNNIQSINDDELFIISLNNLNQSIVYINKLMNDFYILHYGAG